MVHSFNHSLEKILSTFVATTWQNPHPRWIYYLLSVSILELFNTAVEKKWYNQTNWYQHKPVLSIDQDRLGYAVVTNKMKQDEGKQNINNKSQTSRARHSLFLASAVNPEWVGRGSAHLGHSGTQGNGGSIWADASMVIVTEAREHGDTCTGFERLLFILYWPKEFRWSYLSLRVWRSAILPCARREKKQIWVFMTS